MTSPSKRKHVQFDCPRTSSTTTTITDNDTTATATTTTTSRSTQSLLFQNYSDSDKSQNLSQSCLSSSLSSSSSFNDTIKKSSSSPIFPTSLSLISFLSRKSLYHQQTFPTSNSALPQPKSIIKNSHTFTINTDQPPENTSSFIPYFTDQSLSSTPTIISNMNELLDFDTIEGASGSMPQPSQVNFKIVQTFLLFFFLIFKFQISIQISNQIKKKKTNRNMGN